MLPTKWRDLKSRRKIRDLQLGLEPSTVCILGTCRCSYHGATHGSGAEDNEAVCSYTVTLVYRYTVHVLVTAVIRSLAFDMR